MINAVIDTEIWALAKKKPVAARFKSNEEYKRYLRMHSKAVEFFREKVPEIRIYMSLHQLLEIFHVLAFRGTRISLAEARKVVEIILQDKNIVKVPVLQSHVRKAVEDSSKIGIHVWDFLCIIPVVDFIDVAYSCDKHFVKICEEYGIKLVNPVEEWIEI
ncbi:MAG: hypothetical protein DRN04_03580 [Thermoprotei archaeon]|nr:MAG: hypothetical protein DRN04_03580 [Thermoprotei archaeon]